MEFVLTKKDKKITNKGGKKKNETQGFQDKHGVSFRFHFFQDMGAPLDIFHLFHLKIFIYSFILFFLCL